MSQIWIQAFSFLSTLLNQFITRLRHNSIRDIISTTLIQRISIFKFDIRQPVTGATIPSPSTPKVAILLVWQLYKWKPNSLPREYIIAKTEEMQIAKLTLWKYMANNLYSVCKSNRVTMPVKITPINEYFSFQLLLQGNKATMNLVPVIKQKKRAGKMVAYYLVHIPEMTAQDEPQITMFVMLPRQRKIIRQSIQYTQLFTLWRFSSSSFLELSVVFSYCFKIQGDFRQQQKQEVIPANAPITRYAFFPKRYTTPGPIIPPTENSPQII